MPTIMVAEAGGMANISAGVQSLMGMASTMLTTITENPILCALFASGFIGVAVGIVKKLKHV